MAKVFFMFYNSIVIALMLAFISFRVTWLEMRVNVGLLIPVYAAITFLVFFFILKNKRGISRKYKLFTIFNLLVSGTVSTIILGIKSIGVVPAAIIREGLNNTHIKFLHIDLALFVFLAAGILIILLQKVDNES